MQLTRPARIGRRGQTWLRLRTLRVPPLSHIHLAVVYDPFAGNGAFPLALGALAFGAPAGVGLVAGVTCRSWRSWGRGADQAGRQADLCRRSGGRPEAGFREIPFKGEGGDRLLCSAFGLPAGFQSVIQLDRQFERDKPGGSALPGAARCRVLLRSSLSRHTWNTTAHKSAGPRFYALPVAQNRQGLPRLYLAIQ